MSSKETSTPTDTSEFVIVTLKSGIKSLRSLRRNETFHPTSGPMGEATLLHVDQQRLRDRARQVSPFVIWDVGFGAAANVLAVISALKDIGGQVEVHSFDLTTAPIEFAVTHGDELEYTLGFEAELRELLLKGETRIEPGIYWKLQLGDFSHLIKSEEAKHLRSPHAILYDPYSPATNPEMWTLQHFSHLRKRVSSSEGCIFTNYTRSTAVRVALLLSGFFVGAGCVIGEKAETTVAATRADLLERPLDAEWLKRVSQSTNAAPLREAVYSKSEISEEDFRTLQAHPQFLVKTFG